MTVPLLLTVLGLAALAGARAGATPPPAAPLDGDPLVLTGAATAEKTYQVIPFVVPEGTARVEVAYGWTPLSGNVIDLGLWDERGYRSVDGFRGWSGCRQGRIDLGLPPVHVDAAGAERGYRPGPVHPGTWHVELGFASVWDASPAQWRVEVRCLSAPTGRAFVPRRIDPGHVARTGPGWYHGDLHMHGRHSHPRAPDWDGFIAAARRAGLDFLPVTDYVTTAHWDELGHHQNATENADLVIWPGREVVTYFGHAIVLGETPSTVEYRHGFEDVSLADIQRVAVADGALFGIAHPTISSPPLPPGACRGCEFELDGDVDWAAVTTMEVVTGPRRVRHLLTGELVTNPFIQSAIDKWHRRLAAGYRITAVGGSDDKLGPRLGVPATAVHARELSRAALAEALRAGHAYVRVQGVHAGPELRFEAVTDDGRTGLFGDTLAAPRAVMTVTVTGAEGQGLRLLRNGREVGTVPVAGDPFTHTFGAGRAPDEEGPLGTFWGVETFDEVAQTTIANPIFLTS